MLAKSMNGWVSTPPKMCDTVTECIKCDCAVNYANTSLFKIIESDSKKIIYVICKRCYDPSSVNSFPLDLSLLESTKIAIPRSDRNSKKVDLFIQKNSPPRIESSVFIFENDPEYRRMKAEHDLLKERILDLNYDISHKSFESIVLNKKCQTMEYRISNMQSKLDKMIHENNELVDLVRHIKINNDELKKMKETAEMEANQKLESIQDKARLEMESINRIKQLRDSLITDLKDSIANVDGILKKQNELDSRRVDITCPICANDRVSMHLDECGHTFCKKCIQTINTQCPTCRHVAKEGFEYVEFFLP